MPSSAIRSALYGSSTSKTLSLPDGLNGLGSLNTALSSGSSGMWQVTHPSVVNSASPRSAASRAAEDGGSARTGAGRVAWNSTRAVMSPRVSSSAIPSASWSIESPNRSDACIPKCWFIAFTANSRRETIVPFCMNGRITRSSFTPSTRSVSNVPSGLAVMRPNETPLLESSAATSAPVCRARRRASSRMACRSDVISRARSST